MITRSRGRTFQRGSRWWIAYHGPDAQTGRSKEFRESAGKTEAEAKRLLRARLGEIYSDVFLGPEAERVTIAQLIDDYCAHLVLAGKKSVTQKADGTYAGCMASAMKPVRVDLGGLRARELTSQRVRRYIKTRLDAGSAPGSISNEVAYLRAAFRLAHREGRIRLLPHFPGLKVDNARKVFYEPAELRALVGALPEPLNDLVLALYLTARRKNEIMKARWEWIDRATGTLTIPDTKNGDAAVIPIEGELAQVIERRWRAREVRRKDGTVLLSEWLFHRRGKRVRKYGRAFAKACAAAGLTGRWVHDTRRTRIRDLVRAGVHQHVVMAISGHRSPSVFRRYDIVDVRDMRQAITKTEAYLQDTAGSRTETQVSRIGTA